ncbi:hypothetical protein CkaCkLH20_04484 [Colletotrichum karsti]|uniref:Zn(2)-C6 fungal-type domain-containing protein n=1 Tax=Colletotrichum karsti TaxID=1095194 RepID=A0A9P6I7Q5_9PEZI|nr:uncharacterized protein CkaCkLH20_04484 [Colletotrichum karsti]KAF9877908.1 hypothetical protein CkaCkLH20_04484 [Colletotrichum karsti]
MACQACRTKKIKCDRVRPVCQNCRLRASQCSYAGERRTRRWVAEADAENRRLSGSHPSASESNHGPSQRPADAVSGSGSDSGAGQQQPEPRHQQSTARSAHLLTDVAARTDVRVDRPDWRAVIPASSDWNQMDSDSIAGVFTHMDHDSEVIPKSPVGFSSDQDDSLVDKILDGDDRECFKDANPSMWMRMDDGDEYTGPSSGISNISDLGLKWVRQNVPESDDLYEAIQDVRNAILCHLRQPKCIPQDLPLALTTPRQTADVPPSQMLQYINAYFSKVQVVFPILDRATFLSQLSAMGNHSGLIQKPSWLALLNAVLASGCRALLSEETAEAFQASGSEAWGYFQFALSYEPQIIHGATDLMAVQAMAVMTVFAQGLSSPQRLEYTLSSITSRLAHGLGLHRNPPPEWNLAEDEKEERNRVFWAVYCLDKLVFYYPFTALTTIFVHVVSNPPDVRTQSDIALMETAVGFFGRLEHITSGEAAFTKTTEFVRQARKLTEKYKKTDGAGQKRVTTSTISLQQCGHVGMLDTFSNGFDDGQVDDAQCHLEPDAITTLDIGVTPTRQSLYSDSVGFSAPTTEEAVQAPW